MEEEDERWKELCALASRETDPKKLLKIVQEINEILDKKADKRPGNPDSTLNID